MNNTSADDFRMEAPQNLGALEIATFFSLVLYGMSLAQALDYFQRSGKDRLRLKLFVSCLLVLDTFHSFTASHTVYFASVTRWGRAEANSIPLAATVAIESLTTFLVEAFFVQRIHRLSQRASLGLALLSLAVLRLAAATALAGEAVHDVFRTPNGDFVHRLAWLITAGLALGAGTDVLVAGCLVWWLRRMLGRYNLKATTEMLERLVRGAMQTGLLTSVASVGVIIAFQAMDNMVWFGLYVVLAKLYVLSLLVALNARTRTADKDKDAGTGAPTLSLYFAPGAQAGTRAVSICLTAGMAWEGTGMGEEAYSVDHVKGEV